MIVLLFALLTALSVFVLKLSICVANAFNLLFNKLGIDIDFWGVGKDV